MATSINITSKWCIPSLFALCKHCASKLVWHAVETSVSLVSCTFVYSPYHEGI